MAVILGVLNALGMMSFAVIILFAQEVLDTDPARFAVMNTGAAVGGIVGGWTASNIANKIGAGPSLWLTLIGGGATTAAIGLVSSWQAVWLMFTIYGLLAVLWNVITVSLRQAIIPVGVDDGDEFVGRCHSSGCATPDQVEVARAGGDGGGEPAA